MPERTNDGLPGERPPLVVHDSTGGDDEGDEQDVVDRRDVGRVEGVERFVEVIHLCGVYGEKCTSG